MQHAPSLPSFSQSGTTSGLNSSECAILGRYRETFEYEVRIYFDPKKRLEKWIKIWIPISALQYIKIGIHGQNLVGSGPKEIENLGPDRTKTRKICGIKDRKNLRYRGPTRMVRGSLDLKSFQIMLQMLKTIFDYQ